MDELGVERVEIAASNVPEKVTRRAFLVGVELSGANGHWPIEDSLEELKQLAETAGIQVVGSLSQKLRVANPAYYIGRGKVDELKALKSELEFDLCIFDEELSPGQQRNLERALDIQLLDRTALILAVFAQRARTREGRLQVQLAQYEYLLPRLTRQWTHLSRQFGAIGARGGPGETQLETDRRRARERIREVKAEIEEVRTHRKLYRDRRVRAGVPVIALVGYTNAGKSTLFNALTNADVVAENQLFATLDPTTRRVKLSGGLEVLFTDTVGFIQKLPHSLIASFRATLEELESADLLLHVLDIANPAGYEQGQTVQSVLGDLGLGDKPVVTVLNKIDLLKASTGTADEPQRSIEQLEELYPNAVAVSAVRRQNLAKLLAKVDSALSQSMVDLDVLIPYNAGQLAALFREKGVVQEEHFTKEGTRLRGRIAPRFSLPFEPYHRSRSHRVLRG